MKSLFALSLLLAATAPSFASAAPVIKDPENTKVRLSFTDPSSNFDRDCKLSLREIGRYDGYNVGKRYLCAQLTGVNEELYPEDFAALLNERKLVIDYAGGSEQTLLETFVAWRKALERDAENDSNPAEYLKQLKNYSYRLVGRAGNVTTLSLENAKSGEKISFDVNMNVELPKKQQ